MKIANKVAALLFTACALSASVSARNQPYVYFDLEAVGRTALESIAMQKQLQARAEEVRTEQQEKLDGLRKEEEALRKELRALSPEAQKRRIKEFKRKSGKVELEVRAMGDELTELAQEKQEDVLQNLVAVAESMMPANGWQMMFRKDAGAVVAVSPESDVTPLIVAEANKRYQAQNDAKLIAA